MYACMLWFVCLLFAVFSYMVAAECVCVFMCLSVSHWFVLSMFGICPCVGYDVLM